MNNYPYSLQIPIPGTYSCMNPSDTRQSPILINQCKLQCNAPCESIPWAILQPITCAKIMFNTVERMHGRDNQNIHQNFGNGFAEYRQWNEKEQVFRTGLPQKNRIKSNYNQTKTDQFSKQQISTLKQISASLQIADLENKQGQEKLEKISTKSRILQERVDLKRSSRTGSEQLSNVNSKIFSSLSNEKLHNETPTSIHSTHDHMILSNSDERMALQSNDQESKDVHPTLSQQRQMSNIDQGNDGKLSPFIESFGYHTKLNKIRSHQSHQNLLMNEVKENKSILSITGDKNKLSSSKYTLAAPRSYETNVYSADSSFSSLSPSKTKQSSSALNKSLDQYLMSPLSTTSVQKSPSAYLRQNVRSSSTSKELPTDKTSSSFNIDNYSMHRASPSINSTNEIKDIIFRPNTIEGLRYSDDENKKINMEQQQNIILKGVSHESPIYLKANKQRRKSRCPDRTYQLLQPKKQGCLKKLRCCFRRTFFKRINRS